MNDYKQVDQIIEEVKKSTVEKSVIAVKVANACIGWPYVWGAVGGRLCTVANRKMYMNSKNIGQGDINLIKKRCAILSGKQNQCSGCVYYPNDIGTRIFDCQGFIKWILSQVGITLKGGGCTSMWNSAENWSARGTIDTLPKNKVCCVFRDVNGVKEHILLYDGEGNYIHCSGEVKKQAIGSYKATHWAMPRGLYEKTVVPDPQPLPAKPILRKGDSGEYVTLLQSKLLQMGYNIGHYGVDGKFGARTEEAVKEFQFNNNLKVDGIVGTDTWRRLDGESPVPEETYSVLVKKLTKTQAQELKSKYSNAIMTKE